MVLVPPPHRHQTLERHLGIPEHHIIVDRKEWLSAMEKLRLIEDEVRDAMEICGDDFADELRCWDELSDEAWVEFERLVDQSTPLLDESTSAHVRPERAWSYDLETPELKTPLVDYNYPTSDKPAPRTFLDKLRFWTFDDWKDWLMGGEHSE